MMKVRRSVLAVRSLSTKRLERSTKGDAAYESYLQSATVRHRRNRARTKEKKLPENKTEPKRLSGRRERAAKSVIPTRTAGTQTHRTKRIGASGDLAKSARNVPESSVAKRLGMTSQPLAETSTQVASSKSAPIIESADAHRNRSSSKIPLLVLFGLTSGSIVWTLGQSHEILEKNPLFQKYIDEARQLLLPRGDVKSKEMKQDHTSEKSKKEREQELEDTLYCIPVVEILKSVVHYIAAIGILVLSLFLEQTSLASKVSIFTSFINAIIGISNVECSLIKYEESSSDIQYDFDLRSELYPAAPDSDHDATLSDGAPSRNPRGPQPDTEPEDTGPGDQAELTDYEEEREVPLSAWVHLMTNHCRVKCVGPTTNSKQDNIISPRWYEGVPSTKDIDKETGEFIIHGQQYGQCQTEKEMDEHLNRVSTEVLSISDEEEEHDDTDVNTSKVDSEGQFLDGSDDDHQDDLDRINELIAEIEEAKLKKLKAEKA
ncbi:unnamed protein product, partial [Cylindrotheca closterium]